MDSDLRQLERQLKVNTFDFPNRQKLTASYLRSNQGKAVFWRGASRTPADPYALKTEVTYKVGEAEVTEQSYILSVLDLEDLMQMLALSPDAVLNLEDKRLYPLNGRNLISPGLFGTLDARVAAKRKAPSGLSRRDGQIPRYVYYDAPVYDRQIVEAGIHTIKSGVTSIIFFDAVMGSAGIWPKVKGTQTSYNQIVKNYVKSPGDTNIENVGWFPYPREHQIHGFSIIPDVGTSYEDFKNLINRSMLRVIIGTVSYLDVAASLVTGLADDKPADAALRISNPVGPHYCLGAAFDLIPQQNYRVELVIHSEGELRVEKQVSMMCVMWCSQVWEYH